LSKEQSYCQMESNNFIGEENSIGPKAFRFSAWPRGMKLWLWLIGMTLKGNQMNQTKKWILKGVGDLENHH
jgi:hypothetical protein